MGLVWLEVQDGRLGALRPLGLCVGHVLAGSVVLGGATGGASWGRNGLSSPQPVKIKPNIYIYFDPFVTEI